MYSYQYFLPHHCSPSWWHLCCLLIPLGQTQRVPRPHLAQGSACVPAPGSRPQVSFIYSFLSPPSFYFALRQMWWPAWSLKGKRNTTPGTCCCLEMLLVLNLDDGFSLPVCPSSVRGCSILPGLYLVYCREQCSRASC